MLHTEPAHVAEPEQGVQPKQHERAFGRGGDGE
jgi:hypothetical protein